MSVPRRAASMSGWPGDGPECRRALIAVAVGCAILPASFIARLIIFPDVLFPDFFGLWSFGRFALSQPAASIYDEATLHQFQAGFGMPSDSLYSFFYPPPILLLLAPFGALAYGIARVAWLVVTFGGYVMALTAWRWPRPLAVLLLLAPSSAISFLVGQNGFAIAALMLGGLRLLSARPFLAGALLACVGIKPQLAVLIPFLLVFGRHWRALAGAAVMAGLLLVASSLAFGPDIWGAWLATMSGHKVMAGRTALLEMIPTVTSSVLLLGGGARLAALAQAAGALAGVLALWRARGRDGAEARAVLPVATMLATPYAFHYDLPMVTGAVLTVIAARMVPGGRFGGAEFPLLVAAIAIPALLPAHVGALSAVMPPIFAGVLWHLARAPARPARALPSRPLAA